MREMPFSLAESRKIKWQNTEKSHVNTISHWGSAPKEERPVIRLTVSTVQNMNHVHGCIR